MIEGGPGESAIRRLWIAWSLRPDLRPSIAAEIIREHRGVPPRLPLGEFDIPAGLQLRPSDLRLLRASDPTWDSVAQADRTAEALGCSIQTPADGGWLTRLWEEMADPPTALYVRGLLHLPDDRAVAIVGTRHPSPNGLVLAREIARDLAMEGVTVVSGMALGIDGAAHRGALDVNGHTVAVLGCGVDRPHPPSHVELSKRIATTGALVSEFPFGVNPRPLHFPRRNRIIAALSRVIVIVEGSDRSGARSTVDHALAMGREVVAVPRDPVHEGSALPNMLLRSGAAPVRSALDVFDHLDGCRGTATAGSVLSAEDSALFALFEPGKPCGVDGLARLVGRSADEVLASLGRLELAGRLHRLPGARYARAGSAR